MNPPTDDARLLARVATCLIGDDETADTTVRTSPVRIRRALDVLLDAGYHPGQVDDDGLLVPPPHNEDCRWCAPAPPTLIIGDSASWCSGCGRGADPDQTRHLTAIGGDVATGLASDAGCGVEWLALAAAADSRLDSEDSVATLAAARGMSYVGRWSR